MGCAPARVSPQDLQKKVETAETKVVLQEAEHAVLKKNYEVRVCAGHRRAGPQAPTLRTPNREFHLRTQHQRRVRGRGGRGVWHKAPVFRLFAFGDAYWPLATADPDPLWVRTYFGRVNGSPG